MKLQAQALLRRGQCLSPLIVPGLRTMMTLFWWYRILVEHKAEGVKPLVRVQVFKYIFYEIVTFTNDVGIVTSLSIRYDACRRPKTGHPRCGSVKKS